jgi:hypothetical protein
MKRRSFLTITALGGIAAAIPSFKFVSTSFETATINLIKGELPFLKLEDEGIRAFVTDFSKSKSDPYKLTIRAYSFFGIDSSRSGKVNQLVSSYLLSTDFFANKMDESRMIKYVGLYDPYLRPCAHPFSAVHYG